MSAHQAGQATQRWLRARAMRNNNNTCVDAHKCVARAMRAQCTLHAHPIKRSESKAVKRKQTCIGPKAWDNIFCFPLIA